MLFSCQALLGKIQQLSENEAQVRVQLRDAKDHADLLEFRLLEVEELAKVGRYAEHNTRMIFLKNDHF